MPLFDSLLILFSFSFRQTALLRNHPDETGFATPFLDGRVCLSCLCSALRGCLSPCIMKGWEKSLESSDSGGKGTHTWQKTPGSQPETSRSNHVVLIIIKNHVLLRSIIIKSRCHWPNTVMSTFQILLHLNLIGWHFCP